MSTEQEIAAFLDEYLYPRVTESFERVSDVSGQMKGKDVIISIGGLEGMIVDEKAQSHYINRNLPTFAFELSFLRSGGIETEGWLFDESKDTQYYLLIWVTAKKEWGISKDDIKRLECVLLSRERLIEELSSRGLGKGNAYERAREIRESGVTGPIGRGDNDGYYFFHTDRLVERPVNVVVRKELLKSIAERAFVVTRDGVEEEIGSAS